METRFDLLAKAAAGGIPWREALRQWVPRPRLPAGDGGLTFDALTQSLAEEVPRREALRRLVGGLAAAMLASLGLRPGWSQSPRDCEGVCRSQIDPRKSAKEFGRCVASCQDCVQNGGTPCGSSSAGGGAVTCVDLRTNLQHCGSCRNACTAPANATATCAAGTCGFTCNDGYTRCSNACANTNTDPTHCGNCTTVCTAPANATATCTAAMCGFTCNDGYSASGGICCPIGRSNCDGVCTDVTMAPYCGGCGTCKAGAPVCVTSSSGCEGMCCPSSLPTCIMGDCFPPTCSSDAQCPGGLCCGGFCASGVRRCLNGGCYSTVLQACCGNAGPCATGVTCDENGRCGEDDLRVLQQPISSTAAVLAD